MTFLSNIFLYLNYYSSSIGSFNRDDEMSTNQNDFFPLTNDVERATTRKEVQVQQDSADPSTPVKENGKSIS